MSKIVVFFGPSGVGKTTIIKSVLDLCDKCIYIKPYTTRRLRDGETDKMSISDDEMTRRANAGEFLQVNEMYGIRYGAPIEGYEEALREGNFPLIDWPIWRADVWNRLFPDKWVGIYIYPSSPAELKQRLSLDGRDIYGYRYSEALNELRAFYDGEFDGAIDYKFINHDGSVDPLAHNIASIVKDKLS